jgi:hypothetical protein
MKALASVLAAALFSGGFAGPAAAQEEMDVQSQRVIGGVIDTLIGNRYTSERQSVRNCAIAAVNKAERQYRGDFRTQPVAYSGYRGHIRVSEITDVQQRLLIVRVKGLLSTPRHGYGRGRRGSDLSFSCDATKRGNVNSVRVDRNPDWRR